MSTDDDVGIADELAAKQREISVAEFFERNRQMLGFGSKARAIVTATKEGVDNAIDAAEEAEILPDIAVEIREGSDDNYKLTITDNGPGITEEQIPKIFGKLLYGSRFATRVQRRGQQGIGISAAVLYSQLTTGRPAEIISKTGTNTEANKFEITIDTDNNEPEIRSKETVEWPFESNHGTSITIHIEANFRARTTLHEYIKHTAVVNPHVAITLDEPRETIQYDRTVNTVPDQPTEIKPHPHGIEFGELRSLLETTNAESISDFLQTEFTRVGPTTAEKTITAFKNRFDGRYCHWPVPDPAEQIEVAEEETTTLSDYIISEINNKPRTVKTEIATQVTEKLTEEDTASYHTVTTTVNDVADSVEKNQDATIGTTVRETVIKSLWGLLSSQKTAYLTELVQESASNKKNNDDILGYTHALVEEINTRSDGRDVFSPETLRSVIDEAAERSRTSIDNPFGDTARESVFEELSARMTDSPAPTPGLKEVDQGRELAKALHKAMQAVKAMAPPDTCLSPIGSDELVKGMQKAYNADFYTACQRDACSQSGEPFIVEAGIAYGGDLEEEGEIEMLRFANRVPLVYKPGACCTTAVAKGVRWNNYKVSDKGSGLPQGPIALLVHVASTNVPFTSESKDAIASVEVIENEVERAIRTVARDLKHRRNKQQTLQKRQRKRNEIADILPAFADKITAITGKNPPSTTESLAKIMNNLLVSTIPSENKADATVIHVVNFNGRESRTPTVKVTSSTNPGSVDGVEISEVTDNNTWIISCPLDVSPDGEAQFTIPVPQSEIQNISVTGIEDELVTLSN